MKARRLLFAIATAAALAACAELPAILQPPADQVDNVIREAAQLARAPAADQKAALATAQQAFVNDSGSLNRLRLATLLASLPAPLRDDARAGELLEPMVDLSGSATGRFAAFLATQVAERQRVAREIDRLTKERAATERERQAADKERDKREEALRQQLEALRAIERGILDREERLRRNPGAKP
ncbi:MAG TPA: hypothetical protein VH600_09250 [Burkholderiales bacterium]|jgi:hypothetical protein